MRLVAMLNEKDIKKFFAEQFKVKEDHVDIYVDMDGQVVAEIEIKDYDSKRVNG